MHTKSTLSLISPNEYILLANQNGISRNKAIALSGLSPRSFAHWQYQKRNNPSLRSLLTLTRVAKENNWL